MAQRAPNFPSFLSMTIIPETLLMKWPSGQLHELFSVISHMGHTLTGQVVTVPILPSSFKQHHMSLEIKEISKYFIKYLEVAEK